MSTGQKDGSIADGVRRRRDRQNRGLRVKHHQTREGTLKKDVKRIMPLINAIITKGKKSDGKKIEQWITFKFRKVETTLQDNPQFKVKETCNQLKTVAELIGHGGLFVSKKGEPTPRKAKKSKPPTKENQTEQEFDLESDEDNDEMPELHNPPDCSSDSAKSIDVAMDFEATKDSEDDETAIKEFATQDAVSTCSAPRTTPTTIRPTNLTIRKAPSSSYNSNRHNIP
jgi:hypothetical protein